ncbi:MAG: UPF0175 family protein [Acidimicrobiia bacterium]|nr:UPF0175 family protein [Acidimicrobiia bacterium]
MEVTLHIPDEIATHLGKGESDISRRALEALAVDLLKTGRITEAQLCEMLGLHRMELDGFLKAHGVYHDYTMDDLERELEGLRRLGI